MKQKYGQSLAGESVESKTEERQGVSLRAILISLAFLTLMIWLSMMGGLSHRLPEILMDVPSRPALFFTTLMLVLNLLMRGAASRFRFTQRELVAMYLIVGFGYLISNLGFLHVLLFAIMWPQGIILEGDQLGLAMEEFLGRISPLLIPNGEDAIFNYYLGGVESFWDVSFGAWIVPLFMWLCISLLFVFAFVCLATLFMKRWGEVEHLTYPLVAPIIELTQTEDEEKKPLIWKNKLAWAGAILPGVVQIVNLLHRYAPNLPYIALRLDLGALFRYGTFKALAEWPHMVLDFNPLAVGVTYLIPLDVSFSVWFFYLIQRLAAVYTDVLGFAGGRDAGTAFADKHSFGAALGIAVTLIWLARHDLKQIVGRAMRPATDSEAAEDLPMSYRVAVFGGGLSIIVLLFVFQFLLGVNMLVAAMFILFFLALGLSFARVRAEAGVPMSYSFLGNPKNSMVELFGTDVLGRGNMAGLGFFHWEYIPSVMIWSLEGFKMADEVKLRKASITKIIIFTFIFTVIVGSLFALPIFYRYGATTMDMHRYLITQNNFKSMLGEERSASAAWGIGSGAIIVVLLSICRARFLWWPFHPLGYVMGWNIPITYEYWGPFFIAWLIKLVLLRYGGSSLLAKARPFFMGLIAGSVVFQSIMLFISVAVALLTM